MGSDQKHSFREQIKQFFADFLAADYATNSDVISQRILQQPFITNAMSIMVYCPLKDEVDITPVIQQILKERKQLIVPKTDRENTTIIPCVINNPAHELSHGYAGILEPVEMQPVEYGQIDVILVPGRVFDRNGHRIGRGGGYYDRFLLNTPVALKVGIAFDFQMVPMIDVHEHDVLMDLIITENELINISGLKTTM